MERDHYTLSPRDNAAIFHETIAPRLYGAPAQVAQPRALFFRGQPGAGKSVARDKAVTHLAEQDGKNSIVTVDIDAFRQFHPMYNTLQQADSSTAAYYTDLDCGTWTEHAINYAIESGAHIVLEGTLRNEKPTLETARNLVSRGVDPELHLLGVHELISRSRIFQRYINQSQNGAIGRYTLPEAHSAAYDALPGTTERTAASQLFSRINIIDHNGDISSLINGRTSDAAITSVQELLRAQNLSLDNLAGFRSLIETIEGDLQHHGNKQILHDFYKLAKDVRARTIGRPTLSISQRENV